MAVHRVGLTRGKTHRSAPLQGAWTADEDAALTQAHAEFGTAWKKVGALLDRMPEACRDRWRVIRQPGRALRSYSVPPNVAV
jgi:hypothetical protein